METNEVNDMKRRGQKEHSKQGDQQNKFIFITKHTMIHLKQHYGSIILRKIVLCVCVCVCVWNVTPSPPHIISVF